MPEGSLGSQGEVTHCYARADRKGLLLFPVFHSSTAQDRQGWRDEGGTGEEQREGRERGWVTSLFFHLVFNWPLSAFIRVKCSLCVGHQVQWTLSTVSEIVAQLNFKRTNLSIYFWVNYNAVCRCSVTEMDNPQPERSQTICKSSILCPPAYRSRSICSRLSSHVMIQLMTCAFTWLGLSLEIFGFTRYSQLGHTEDFFFLKQGPFDDGRQAAQWLPAAPQCNSTVSQLAALNRLHRQVHSISYGASSSPLRFVWQIPPLFLWWCFSFVGTLACLVD